MRTKSNLHQARLWAGVLVTLCFILPGNGDERAKLPTPDGPLAKQGEAIPWSQLGAKAGANYQGDGLTITATTEGARLRCVFQKLDGEATSEGLWLASTAPGRPNDRFRVKAVEVGREGRAGSPLPAAGGASVSASRLASPKESGAHGVRLSQKVFHRT